MTGGRAGTRRSARRRAILRATQTVMLGEGYASVTFERVASVAGVAKSLVYYYFSTLDELFIAVLQDFMDHFLARMSAATPSGASRGRHGLMPVTRPVRH
ncbi:MAG: TetR/AcrR family transcriptional regulator [Mycobacterium sp.]|uniref:TetR/AcrR family transcriptional regulator n=1 Tax=Mycobacterium sp. TaxID=1785 RepID=UPI003F9E5D54